MTTENDTDGAFSTTFSDPKRFGQTLIDLQEAREQRGFSGPLDHVRQFRQSTPTVTAERVAAYQSAEESLLLSADEDVIEDLTMEYVTTLVPPVVPAKSGVEAEREGAARLGVPDDLDLGHPIRGNELHVLFERLFDGSDLPESVVEAIKESYADKVVQKAKDLWSEDYAIEVQEPDD